MGRIVVQVEPNQLFGVFAVLPKLVFVSDTSVKFMPSYPLLNG